ncbi:MAG: leucine--tRNA ligase [Clostridia bacterium]|nr:leucine--tRNA ligase [Clostridia bacterium]
MESFIYSKQTDLKWQKKWWETDLYRFDETRTTEKFYLLEMFSYPSGKTLHTGHWWNYGLSDSYGRFKRMQGYNVFHPPGFDAFGLPAENYAIKTGVHPSDSTKNNIATMEKQFHAMGTTYDWNFEIITCNEEYYKWTQWLFLKLFNQGLAYRKEAPVNWCPSCMTVLANEQAATGKCERCDNDVVRRNMTQWFFKITEYAEELLAGLDTLDWPDKTKIIQKNWIGKSFGTEINFKCGDDTITVFTTRADTLMGVTYVVLAPEHPLVDKLTASDCMEEVKTYRDYTVRQSDIERTSTAKEKTGVFTGSYAVHPISGEQIPIWIADYVLQNYGTGAVMAVPAHDERDFEFAEKYNLPFIRVVTNEDESPLPFCDDGALINSGIYNGLSSEQARQKIYSDLEATEKGKQTVKYHLRDWLVSRQRYWGAPIPIIHCNDCGAVPVPENELPIRLPYNVEFRPSGESPLSTCAEFVNTICPVCGKPAKRDTDTLDTFVCSSWYFLRFFDNKNADAPFDKTRVNQIMPVDKYVGGIEHATMHLLYARFVTKVLRDMGYLNFGEPFPSLFHQGIITGKDGKKMSKRDGAVSPDVLIEQYGSDVFRLYLGFGFSYIDGGPWDDDGIKAIARFVSRIGRLIENFIVSKPTNTGTEYKSDEKLEYVRNHTIKQVTNNLESFCFNTAIARIMEFSNAVSDYQKKKKRNNLYEEALLKDLILLLAPLAPHFTEELWGYIGCPYSVHNQNFPVCDESKLIKNTINIAVQVNGNLRDVISIENDMDEDKIKQKALSSAKVQTSIGENHVKKIIYIKGRIINIVY